MEGVEFDLIACRHSADDEDVSSAKDHFVYSLKGCNVSPRNLAKLVVFDVDGDVLQHHCVCVEKSHDDSYTVDLQYSLL